MLNNLNIIKLLTDVRVNTNKTFSVLDYLLFISTKIQAKLHIKF